MGTAPVHDTRAEALGSDLSGSSPMGPIEKQHSFLPLLQLLWANGWSLFRAGVCAFLASTLLAFLIPVRYQAVTRLMPPESQSETLGMLAAAAGSAGAAALSGIAGDLLGVKSSGALFVGILGSDTVQDRLIEEFHLMDVYGDSKIEDARRDLTERTDVSEDRKSGIVSIAVTDHDPKRAAAMAQAYVAKLNLLVAEVSTSSARRERLFLEERLQKVQADLSSAENNFSDFASKNTAIDIPEQGKAMVNAAAILQGQLIAAQAELSGLQQIYADNNVRVRAAAANVGELQKKLEEIGGGGTQADPQGDSSLYPSIRKLPLLGVPYADLYRQTKVQETVYELLTQQYELAKVQEAKEIPTVKVLDAAMVPTKKSFPPRSVIIALGTMLGITLMTTWIVWKAQWDAVDASDPRKMFAIEVLTATRAQMLRFSRNGYASESNGHRHLSEEPKQTSSAKREVEDRNCQ